jgi:organic radical activating enzyme
MPTYKSNTRPNPGHLKLVELFETVQGEGKYIGTPSVFVRTGMCNLECAGCDTVWDEWKDTPIGIAAGKIMQFKAMHVVLTGGEPTLWQDSLDELLRILGHGYIVTVESNGAVPIRNAHLLNRVDLWSFSPKYGTLGNDQKFKTDVVLDNLDRTYGFNQLKFVLDPSSVDDTERIVNFIDEAEQAGVLPEDDMVFFQPYDVETLVNVYHAPGFVDPGSALVKFSKLTSLVMERWGSRFRVLPQMHKLLAYR